MMQRPEGVPKLFQLWSQVLFLLAHNLVSSLSLSLAISHQCHVPWRDPLENGIIFAYELPKKTHSRPLAAITRLIGNWCVNSANQTCEAWSETDLIVPGGYYAPDCALYPIGRPTPPIGTDDGGAYPTLVVEVGYTQTITQLHARAAVYFGATTDIRLYLAIKIYDQFNNGTQAMLVRFYQRANANPLIPNVISFGSRNLHPAAVGAVNNLNPTTFTGVGQGGAACNAIGVAGYQIQLPALALPQYCWWCSCRGSSKFSN